MSRSAELGVNAHEKACFQNRTVVRGNFSRFPEDFWGPGLIFGVMTDQFVNGLIYCYCIVSFNGCHRFFLWLGGPQVLLHRNV